MFSTTWPRCLVVATVTLVLACGSDEQSPGKAITGTEGATICPLVAALRGLKVDAAKIKETVAGVLAEAGEHLAVNDTARAARKATVLLDKATLAIDEEEEIARATEAHRDKL
ncbi:hypothetical protein ERJ75_000345900 [Trypanosoma vivax]|nr:hypothetical protein ERJ75_000345900 [Trypanosoma vivax]